MAPLRKSGHLPHDGVVTPNHDVGGTGLDSAGASGADVVLLRLMRSNGLHAPLDAVLKLHVHAT